MTACGLCGVKAVGVDPVFFIILLFYKKKDKSSKACDFTVDASCSQTSSAVAVEGISM